MDPPDRKLFRAMRPDETDPTRPRCGPTARTLGVRPGVDVPVADDGSVRPGTGGMSVTPDDPRRLPPHRRPRALGGEGKDPVFVIHDTALGERLGHRPDPSRPGAHGFVEPALPVPAEQYQQALCDTGPRWRLV